MYDLEKDECVDFTKMKLSQQKIVLKLPLEHSMKKQRCQQVIKFSIPTNLEKKSVLTCLPFLAYICQQLNETQILLHPCANE